VSGYTLIVRTGGRVRKHRHERLDEALAELRRSAGDLAGSAPQRAVGGRLMRRFEPVQQVVGRVELKGPGVRAGVDVRGDGSAEAFTGRTRRSLVHQAPGESPYDALARELGV
jgi:hypothetical protein